MDAGADSLHFYSFEAEADGDVDKSQDTVPEIQKSGEGAEFFSDLMLWFGLMEGNPVS